jgi:hypothetical protein
MVLAGASICEATSDDYGPDGPAYKELSARYRDIAEITRSAFNDLGIVFKFKDLLLYPGLGNFSFETGVVGLQVAGAGLQFSSLYVAGPRIVDGQAVAESLSSMALTSPEWPGLTVGSFDIQNFSLGKRQSPGFPPNVIAADHLLVQDIAYADPASGTSVFEVETLAVGSTIDTDPERKIVFGQASGVKIDASRLMTPYPGYSFADVGIEQLEPGINFEFDITPDGRLQIVDLDIDLPSLARLQITASLTGFSDDMLRTWWEFRELNLATPGGAPEQMQLLVTIMEGIRVEAVSVMITDRQLVGKFTRRNRELNGTTPQEQYDEAWNAMYAAIVKTGVSGRYQAEIDALVLEASKFLSSSKEIVATCTPNKTLADVWGLFLKPQRFPRFNCTLKASEPQNPIEAASAIPGIPATPR